MFRLWLFFSNVVRKKSRAFHYAKFVLFLLCFFMISIVFVSVRDWHAKPYTDAGVSDDLHFAVVVDAGSSGSRVFIYAWPPHTGNPTELLRMEHLKDETGQLAMKKIQPGLSSISEGSQATEYLRPLLEFASESVPRHHHRQTPLYVLATAGMRLLNSSMQSAILDDIKRNVPKHFDFAFSESSVEVISGKQEGVYQWMAINYVLGRFDHKSEAPLAVIDVVKPSSDNPLLFRTQTVGILDMGGASMQIAFEITSKVQLDQTREVAANNLAEFNLGCLEHGLDHLYTTYVSTYLGLGANEALEAYDKYIFHLAKENHLETNESSPFPDPCRPLALRYHSNHTDGSTFYVEGTGDHDKCKSNLLPILMNLTGCPGSRCLFSKLPIDYTNGQFYGFSEFWYSLEDVLRIGGNYDFRALQKASKDFCGTPWSVSRRRYDEHLYPLADFHRFQTQCFKAAWVTTVLHEGLGFPIEFSRLRSSPNAIEGKVAHWTLGAALYRTRYYPLGDLRREKTQGFHSSYFPNLFYLDYYWFVACFLLVFGAIVLYLRRLQWLRVHPKSFPGSAGHFETGFVVSQ